MFTTYIHNNAIINKFESVKTYGTVGYYRNSVNIPPSPTAIEIIKNEITAPHVFDRVERIMALRMVDSQIPINEMKEALISSYKILFSLESTTIESIDRFRKATYPIVSERDKFFKLSSKEYLALSFKLIEKGIIFDKRKNCFHRCSS